MINKKISGVPIIIIIENNNWDPHNRIKNKKN